MKTSDIRLKGHIAQAAFCPACGTETELRESNCYLCGYAQFCPICNREVKPTFRRQVGQEGETMNTRGLSQSQRAILTGLRPEEIVYRTADGLVVVREPEGGYETAYDKAGRVAWSTRPWQLDCC